MTMLMSWKSEKRTSLSDVFLIATPSEYVVTIAYSEDAAKKAKKALESYADYGYHDLTIQKIVKTEMVR